MADRSIVVKLRAEHKQAVDAMKEVGDSAGQAADKIEETGKKSQQSSQKAQGAFSRMAKHAAENERAWTTAGTALTVAGGAIVGLGLSAGKAGVEFNSLKQTSGAALKSVMGSAEGASRQMDKLNRFGKDSWVMRDALIRAQQQLTGFGVEAERVVPILDGLQEAVAAAGGDSQTFEELAGVMAKVKAEGKITATTFREFGVRGVDAAGLIGEAMGKTGDEIRASVTEGSLDADEALDALAEGMKTKFDGATENLRNTFRGAMDNLSAAWRDLSASMAEPLVGPDGGGLAVSGLNALADALTDTQKRLEELPNGAKGAILALGGIMGAGSLAAGGFLLLLPRIVETKKAFDTLVGAGGVIGTTTKAMGKVGKAATIAAGGFLAAQLAGAAFNSMLDTSSRSSEEMTNRLKQLNDATQTETKNTILDPDLWEEANGFWTKGIGAKDIETWGDAFERSSDKASKWIDSILNTRSDATILQETINETDSALTELASNGAYDEVAKGFRAIADQSPDMVPAEVLDRFPELKGHLTGVATDMGLVADKSTLVKLATGEIKPPTDEASESFSGLSAQAQAAQEHLDEVREGLVQGANGFLDFTEKAKESKTTLQEWINDMEEQVQAQAEWMDNLERLAERGAPQELLDQLLSMGPEGAAMVKKLADGSDEDMQRVIDVFSRSKKNVDDFADSIAGVPDVDLDADASKLRKQVKTAKERLDELREMPTTPEIDAQIKLLEEKVKSGRAKLKELEKEPTTAKVDADTSEAKEEVNGFKKWFKDNSSVTMSVWANIKETFTPAKNSGKKPKPGYKAPEYIGYYGGVIQPYAQGGLRPMDPVAQMVQPNTWRVVGDRMDVDEAYIPLDGSSRSRSILMEAIDRMPNLTAMASGGIVGRAERRLAEAQKRLDAISNAGRKKTAEDRRRDRAQAQVDRARDALTAAKEAEAKRERITSLRSDLRQDVRRGSIRDQVTGSLSGGYSAVDRLFNLGSNEDLSRASRSKANSSARKFEANLRSLYAQADKIDEKLKAAQDKAQELQGIKDSVASGLLGDRSVDVGDYQNFTGGQWETFSGVAGATRRLTADVGAMKSFAGKLKKLAEAGIPGAIIQEIAQSGVAEGSTMADAFLDASDAERKSYIGAWSEYEKYANQAGQYVTEGFYTGGAAAADGVVKGLEGKQKNIESAIANLAKTMENTFRSVLGIHSPSRVMSELGEFTAEGLALGMLGGVPDVQSAADALAGAAIPHNMAFEVSASPVVSDDEGMAELAMQDMSASTLEAMQLMQLAVSEGWANMLLNTQDASAGMLAGTQAGQAGMLNNVQTQQEAMRAAVAQKQLDSRNTVAREQENMRATVSQKQTDSRSKLTTEQENMRSTVSKKQSDTRAKLTQEQESMRSIMADKQTQMRVRNANEFESMRSTTGSKLTTMRASADNTMSGFSSDYSGHLSRLKATNRAGFESMLDASNRNMRGIRDGMDGQMKAARPELGGNLNRLIDVLAKFTNSVNKAFGDVGVKLDAPNKVSFATGGVMPGYTPGRDVHQFRSPTAGELYLSGGEAIMRPEFTKAVGGEAGVKNLNRAARQSGDAVNHMLGDMGFASGGVFGRIPGVNAFADSGVWRNLWAMTKAQFPNARLTSSYRGGSITASGNLSHHARGNAIDVSPSMDIFNWWRNNYGADLAELIYSPAGGKQIKNGRNYTYTGAVKAMHYNHVHIAAVKALSEAMASGLPGAGGGMSHPFLDRAKVSAGGDLGKSYKKAAQKLTKDIMAKHVKQLPGGIANPLGKGIMSQVSDGLIKKATEYGKNSGMGDFSNVASGPVKQMAKQMLDEMGWGDQFGNLNWLLNRESGWRPTAQNPRSTAYGLFQFLDSTWGTVGGSKTSDPKKQLEYGLKYIKQRYGDVNGARAFWERNHWYEEGTDHAKKGWAVVGENGPELVQMKGGEKVYNGEKTRRMLAENRSFVGASGGGINYDALAKAVVNNLPPSLVVNNDNAGLIEERIARKTVQEFTDKQNLYTMGARV